jgi:hypothetical protein
MLQNDVKVKKVNIWKNRRSSIANESARRPFFLQVVKAREGPGQTIAIDVVFVSTPIHYDGLRRVIEQKKDRILRLNGRLRTMAICGCSRLEPVHSKEEILDHVPGEEFQLSQCKLTTKLMKSGTPYSYWAILRDICSIARAFDHSITMAANA